MSRFALVFLWILQSCTNNSNHSQGTREKVGDTAIVEQNVKSPLDSNASQNDSLVSLIDTLNKEESAFLKEISQQNEFILLSNKVKRYYSRENLKAPLFNEIIYSDELLQKNGYVSMSLKYIGKIFSIKIFYSYSLGQASTGYGSILGNSFSDYLHSFNSCGLTNCIVDVFKNQSKIFEKVIPNN